MTTPISMQARFTAALTEHQRLFTQLNGVFDAMADAVHTLHATVERGGKILLCGNGGSAADAQHTATELVVRYRSHRPALPAIALTTDSSILTAGGNDYGFESVFARQVEALGRPEDCLIVISTSGQSLNVVQAAQVARKRGLTVIGLTGVEGGGLASTCDIVVRVPAIDTARIQEAHIFILHTWCEELDRKFTVLHD